MMNISSVAKKTGLTPKAIRFYEQKGLVSLPARRENGYRSYNARHLEELTLLRQARQVGFTLEECRELVVLFNDHGRHSADVKHRMLAKVREIEAHIAELNQMRQHLLALAASCPGDQGAECPIMDNLAGCYLPATLCGISALSRNVGCIRYCAATKLRHPLLDAG